MVKIVQIILRTDKRTYEGGYYWQVYIETDIDVTEQNPQIQACLIPDEIMRLVENGVNLILPNKNMEKLFFATLSQPGKEGYNALIELPKEKRRIFVGK